MVTEDCFYSRQHRINKLNAYMEGFKMTEKLYYVKFYESIYAFEDKLSRDKFISQAEPFDCLKVSQEEAFESQGYDANCMRPSDDCFIDSEVFENAKILMYNKG